MIFCFRTQRLWNSFPGSESASADQVSGSHPSRGFGDLPLESGVCDYYPVWDTLSHGSTYQCRTRASCPYVLIMVQLFLTGLGAAIWDTSRFTTRVCLRTAAPAVIGITAEGSVSIVAIPCTRPGVVDRPGARVGVAFATVTSVRVTDCLPSVVDF